VIDRILNNILETIGNTPMVKLERLTRNLDGEILAKIEFFNPGFSKKDRIALQVIEDAEKEGRLKKGQPVIELTSGSTGTGLAIVCTIKGYPFIAVMSRGNSSERARMMKAFGAEVILVDQAEGSPPGTVTGRDLELVEAETRRITRERQAFRVDQFNNLSNVLAHEVHTGEEIWEQTHGQLDVFLDFSGSAGTFMGVARTLKKKNPRIRCYLVEPENAAYLSGGDISNPYHKIQGGGYCLDLPFLDSTLVEDYILVSEKEARESVRLLAREEAIFAGYSSGANLAAAFKLLQERERGKRIVILIVDSGLKYLSTDLYEF